MTRLPDYPPRSIHDAFIEAFDREPNDDSLIDLPVESNCGDACMAEIGIALVMIEENPQAMRDEIIASTENKISILWHG